ncbi:hypothetical protein A6R68_13741, partial [Neotoma lepida]
MELVVLMEVEASFCKQPLFAGDPIPAAGGSALGRDPYWSRCVICVWPPGTPLPLEEIHTGTPQMYGVQEQNYVAHIMAFAGCSKPYADCGLVPLPARAIMLKWQLDQIFEEDSSGDEKVLLAMEYLKQMSRFTLPMLKDAGFTSQSGPRGDLPVRSGAGSFRPLASGLALKRSWHQPFVWCPVNSAAENLAETMAGLGNRNM